MEIWIKKNIIEERAKATAQAGGLKIAGASGDGKQGESIGVVLSVDKDEATQRAERDKEAAAKRVQNALPAWHLKSTISGDLTALGIKESVREAEETREPDRLPSSNDAILRGIFKAEEPAMTLIGEDIKPAFEQNHEADCLCFRPVHICCSSEGCFCRLRSILRVSRRITCAFRASNACIAHIG